MREIKDTVHSLRAEIHTELDSGLKELELRPMMSTSDMDNDEESHSSVILNMERADYSTRVWAETYKEQHLIK